MKKLIIILIIISGVSAFAQAPEIKSLKVYPAGSENAYPVISGNDTREKITIEFDMQTDFIPGLSIVFRYCDRNWMPYNNLFLVNTGRNIFYDLDYETLPSIVRDARYHFKGDFPDENETVTFPFSGKWRFYITDSFDTSLVYGQGKFFVIFEETQLKVNIKREQLEDKTYFPTDLAKIFNITAAFSLSDELFPNFVTHMEIIENQETDYSFIVDRTFNTNTRQFYWNGSRNFSFTIRDIQPGNEYRQSDLRDHNKFISMDVKAQFDGLEYSRFFKQGIADLNGGSILTDYKNEYADYMNVTFSIRPPEEVTGSIFLTGSFNNWSVLPSYEMKKQAGVYSLTLNLKRGIYDYQYVTADVINNQIKSPNWLILEGNSWQTVNDYYIFIYYNEPQYGGYDKIIGYKKVQSK